MKSYLETLLLSTLAVFAPIKAVFLVTGFLIFTDLLTGILAARKRGEEIKSAALRRTLTKIFVYNIAVITGFLIEMYMLDGFLPVSKIISGLIAAVEGKSILENLDKINGGNLFKSVIKKLGSINDHSSESSTSSDSKE